MRNIKIILKTLNAYIRTKLHRFVQPKRYKQIFNEIDKIHPRVILEIGTWNGSRAKQMIERASVYHPITEIHYIGFDLFESLTLETYSLEVSKKPPKKDEVQKQLESTGAKITLIPGSTIETMKELSFLPSPDLVFIDGGHATETVRNDWNAVQKIINKNSSIIFDDYWYNRPDGPRVVIDGIDRGKYKVEIMSEVDVFYNSDFGKLVIFLVKVNLK